MRFAKDDRRDAATAATGYTGLAASGAMRHHGLKRAYEKQGRQRPKFPLWHERAFLKTRPGRRLYLGGVALSTLSSVPAAQGTWNLMQSHRDVTKRHKKDQTLLGESLAGTRDAWHQRVHDVSEPVPAKYRGQSWVGGLASGAAAGALTHRLLRHRVLPEGLKAGIPTMAGVAAGVATTPLVNRAVARESHGRYEVTPSGAHRARRKPQRPSRAATVVEARPGRSNAHPAYVREQLVPSSVTKYYGQDMTPGQKRARVVAAGATPFIGDWTAAAQAARMAPRDQRHSAAATTLAGSYGGSLAGSVAGGYGAVRLAQRHEKVGAAATKLSDGLDAVTARAKNKGRKPTPVAPEDIKPSRLVRLASHAKTPRLARRVIEPMAHNPKVAAAGMFVGGAIGGPAGQIVGYDSALHREAHRKTGNPNARHGTRVAKTDQVTGMTRREELTQLKRKQRSAVLGATAGGLGLTSLGLLGAAALPKVPSHVRGRLARTATGASIVGGGVGGYNALANAHLARHEIKARRRVVEDKPEETSKALRVRPTVEKSWVPGVGWRSATKLTPRQRTLIPGGHAKAKGMTRFDRGWKRDYHQFASEIRSNPQEWSGVKHKPGLSPKHLRGSTARLGSKSHGTSFVRGEAGTPEAIRVVQAHEDQHARPRRNSYRQAQMIRDRVKLRREEARADYFSSGHYNEPTVPPRLDSDYARTARLREQAIKHPNRPTRGSKEHQRTIGQHLPNYERYTNERAWRDFAENSEKLGRNPDKAADAYRDLHNLLRAKGVRPGMRDVNKSIRLPGMGTIAPPGVRRAKTYRASTFRQTRTSTGVLMPTRVRASLG